MSTPSAPEPPRRPSIRRRLVTDEQMRPVAVQIAYEDWIEIERALAQVPLPSDDFDALLERSRGIWTQGDGLAYQQRLREEWEDTET